MEEWQALALLLALVTMILVLKVAEDRSRRAAARRQLKSENTLPQRANEDPRSASVPPSIAPRRIRLQDGALAHAGVLRTLQSGDAQRIASTRSTRARIQRLLSDPDGLRLAIVAHAILEPPVGLGEARERKE